MTKRILQLTTVLSNQIAAGEVIERPASVVKELVENSLDAKSTQIEIDIEGGGIHLIRIRDNGCGIVKEDLPLAFARHATSKIATVDDLEAIATLGFRGEALASIASVSRCRLLSKAINQKDAWQIQLAADMRPSISPIAHSQGTTVEIADLFYNTPVRRKFIRSEKTEFQAIDDTVKRLALSYPSVSFRLTHQNKLVRYYPGVSARMNESSRVEKICGSAFMNQAISIELEAYGLKLHGWLGSPHLLRRQADCQYFFVNQRMVKDRLLNHVIKTIYQEQTGLSEGTYPSYVLYLKVDLGDVDVNVHPTKQEVRFSQPRHIHDFISKAIGEALVQYPSVTRTLASKTQIFAPKMHQSFTATPMSVTPQRYALHEDETGITLCDLEKGRESFLKTYLLGWWGRITRKNLLFVEEIPLSPELLADLRLLSWLNDLGYWIKIKPDCLMMMAVPNIFAHVNPCEFLKLLIKEIVTSKDKNAICEWLARNLPLQSLFMLDHETFIA
ncbi:MAG: DNA mismatch repair endonuclease MutL, partial [Candidatus Berkiella sp.]